MYATKLLSKWRLDYVYTYINCMYLNSAIWKKNGFKLYSCCGFKNLNLWKHVLISIEFMPIKLITEIQVNKD